MRYIWQKSSDDKTEYKDPEVHRHSAAHILISLEGAVRFQVDGQEMTGFGAVIPSGLPHTVCGALDEEGKPLSMPSLLLFLFDETTSVAQSIRESRLITEKQAQTVLQWYRDMREAADAAAAYPSFLRQVLKELGLSDNGQIAGNPQGQTEHWLPTACRRRATSASGRHMFTLMITSAAT